MEPPEQNHDRPCQNFEALGGEWLRPQCDYDALEQTKTYSLRIPPGNFKAPVMIILQPHHKQLEMGFLRN